MIPTVTRPLSPYLEGIATQGLFDQETLEQANELPTPEMQEMALDRYREEKSKLMKSIVSEMLGQASGKIIRDAFPQNDLIQAVGDDLLDRYIPSWGEVTGVLRQWARRLWQNQKSRTLLILAIALWVVPLLWGPAVWLITAPYRLARSFLMNKEAKVTITVPPPQERIEPASVSTLPDAAEPLTITPNATREAGRGSREEDRWPLIKKDLPSPAFRIPNPASAQPTEPIQPVDSPPVQPAKKKNFVSSFAKHLLKNSDGAIASSIPIDPVADGVVAVKNAALTAHDESKTVTPAPARVPAPANLRGVRSGSRGVRLTWVAAGPDYRYNVYAAYADNPNSWDIGNDQPLKGPEITWTAPAKGTQMFELYLKTVDAQGRESAPSNHIVVDLR